MHIIIFLIILRSGLCRKSYDAFHKVQRGSDVTLRCDVHHLSESSTLQWIKDTGQTSNTTLVYNNSAYIILHNVDDHSEGKYYCILMEDGNVKTVINHTLSVTPYSESKKFTIYRQSSSHSDLLLICKSKKNYSRSMWTWGPHSETELIAVEKGGEVQVKGTIKPGRKTSTTYNGLYFILHISPVMFSYNGTYRCFPDSNPSPYTSTILHNIRVSAAPPGGVLNQLVVLTCEVSDVSDSVTLVWLRMQGNRGELVKQQTLNETNKKILLTLNVSSLESDLLHWECAVFTENTLRALAPITFRLISSTALTSDTSGISIETSTSPNQGEISTQDNHIQTVILVACAVTVTVLILLGLLAFKCQRKTFTGDVPSVTEMRPYSNTCQTDSVGTGHDNVLNSQEEELHYASLTVVGCSQGADSWLKTNSRLKVMDSSDTVIYSAIKIQ